MFVADIANRCPPQGPKDACGPGLLPFSAEMRRELLYAE